MGLLKNKLSTVVGKSLFFHRGHKTLSPGQYIRSSDKNQIYVNLNICAISYLNFKTEMLIS